MNVSKINVAIHVKIPDALLDALSITQWEM